MDLIKNYHLQRQFPRNGQLEKANNNYIHANENKYIPALVNKETSKAQTPNIASDVVPLITNISSISSQCQDNNLAESNSSQHTDEKKTQEEGKTIQHDEQIRIPINEKTRWHSQAQFDLHAMKLNEQSITTTENETEDQKEEIEFFFEIENENSEKKNDNINTINSQKTKKSAVRFYAQKENQENQSNLQKIKKSKDTFQTTNGQMKDQLSANKKYKTRNSLNPKVPKSKKPLFEEDIFSLSSRTRSLHKKMQKQRMQNKNQPMRIREVKSENPELFPSMKNIKKQQNRLQ